MDISNFLEIERKYGLYKIELNGINYWNYSRVPLWNYQICAQKLKLEESKSNTKIGLLTQIKKVLKLIRNSIWRGKVESGIDVLFVAHERRTKIDGRYQCIYTECLAQMFQNSIIFDRPFRGEHYPHLSNCKRYYGDYITLLGNIHYHFHAFFRTLHYKKTLEQIKAQVQRPLEKLIEDYRLTNGSIENFFKVLHKNYLLAECNMKLYERFLKKIKPKLIVEVVYYTTHNMMLNELAKKYGIVTIELQHGTMHKDHAAYQINWEREIAQLPDKIFLFSEFWKKMIHMPIMDSNMVVTGFPFFEQNKQRYELKKKECTGKNILFISQATIGDSLGKLAAEIAKDLLPRGYRITYKLHPSEINVWEKKYSYLIDSGVEIERYRDVYECFKSSDIQVGVYSTAIYEGLGFGLRTFIYNIGHADTMYELANEGYVQIINSKQEMLELLAKENLRKKECLFWAENALDKMKKEIQSLIIN